MTSPYPTTLTIRPASDQVATALAVDPPYIEQFWLPVVGPSGIFVWRRLVFGLTLDGGLNAGGEYQVDVVELGQSVGLAGPLVRKALDRIERLKLIRRRGDVVYVQVALWPLSAWQAARLPAQIRDAWIAAHTAREAS